MGAGREGIKETFAVIENSDPRGAPLTIFDRRGDPTAEYVEASTNTDAIISKDVSTGTVSPTMKDSSTGVDKILSRESLDIKYAFTCMDIPPTIDVSTSANNLDDTEVFWPIEARSSRTW